jgi:hypothetical protein
MATREKALLIVNMLFPDGRGEVRKLRSEEEQSGFILFS